MRHLHSSSVKNQMAQGISNVVQPVGFLLNQSDSHSKSHSAAPPVTQSPYLSNTEHDTAYMRIGASYPSSSTVLRQLYQFLSRRWHVQSSMVVSQQNAVGKFGELKPFLFSSPGHCSLIYETASCPNHRLGNSEGGDSCVHPRGRGRTLYFTAQIQLKFSFWLFTDIFSPNGLVRRIG